MHVIVHSKFNLYNLIYVQPCTSLKMKLRLKLDNDKCLNIILCPHFKNAVSMSHLVCMM